MSQLWGKKNGFTLVELLAVIAIMAILLIAAVPAFNSFKQKGIQGPVTQLMSTLRLARQYAVTHRQWVYVVFPDDTEVYNPPGEVSKAFRSYAVLAVTNQWATNYMYVSEWKYLPKGVCFYKPNASEDSCNIFHENAISSNRYPFPSDLSGKDRKMPAVLFKPNGHGYGYGASWSDFSVSWIIMTEGFIFIDTNAGAVLSSTNLSGTDTLEHPIRIYNKTGQIDYKRVTSS